MIFRIDNLTKEYGKNNSYQKVLDNISISFKSNEFVCILGESGSGKSSLLNIMGGLDNDYKGSVNINNMNIKYINQDEYRKNNIGFIFQNFNLINNLSVIDNIILPIEKDNISYRKKRNMAISLLRRLNIYTLKNKKINELSGGQKQRVAIARGLINNPRIILADEPTGALDEENSKNILEILKEINKEGKLVIVVTHSKKVIDYSTRVIEIKDGKIYKDQKIKKVKETIIDSLENKENKYLYLIKHAFKNLKNNKRRNLFIVLASSIGIIGIILSLFLGDGVKNYINDLIVSKSDPNNYSIESKYKYYESEIIDKVSNIRHIDKVNKELNITIANINYNDKEYTLTYLDSLENIKIDKGDNKGLLINRTLNKKINLGDTVKLTFIDNYNVFNRYIKVTGLIPDTGINLIDNTYIAMIDYSNLDSIYKDYNIELRPNNISIKIDSKDNLESIKKDLKKIKLVPKTNEDYYNELKKYLDIASLILSIFSISSLVVSTIMISIIINITVLERVKEIGLLRSIGYSKKDVKNIFKSESLSLGICIWLFSIYLSSLVIEIVKYIVNYRFDIKINTNNIKYYLISLFISLFVTYISSLIPSNKASNLDPINALRSE
jgi:ABC-type lipoprotein export system ATPase subunit/ABC-type lipoprotein release transport system permease subunit